MARANLSGTPPTLAGPGRAVSSYSRFVEFMKVFLPLSAAALVAIFIGYSALNRSMNDLTLSFADLARMGDRLEMRNPTLTYTDDAARSFIVEAELATQLAGGTDRWRLERIRARMTPPSGAGYRLTSNEGVLDAAGEELDLTGAVLVRSDEGYTFEAEAAHVDLGAGRVTSDVPVRATGPGTTIVADRFELWDKGDRMRFEGRVRFVSDQQQRGTP